MKPGDLQPDNYPQYRKAYSSSIVLLILFGLLADPAKAQKGEKAQLASPQRTAPVHPLPVGEETVGNARPAAVTLKNGTLTIRANDSDLSQILRDVSLDSGMIIKGSVKDTRVYGNYGPQDPCDILTELLTGLGYNIIMVGTARDGAPRELMLTNRSEVGSAVQPVKAPATAGNTGPGPGAIAHPPPPQVDDPQIRARQNLQKLQEIHAAQEKGNIPP